MPPKAKHTREEIVQVAFEMTREKGFDAVTTREIGRKLGTSSSPIFTLFKNMNEVKQEVRKLAMKKFEGYVADVRNYSPAFKQFGIKMVEFAINEPKLFQILYIDEHEKSATFDDVVKELGAPATDCKELLKEEHNLTDDEAALLFEQVWLHTFSMCVLIVNNVCSFSQEQISRTLSIGFQGMLGLIKSGSFKDIEVCETAKANE